MLAWLFALVMGISMWALLVGDYMQPNSVMNDQARQTLRIVGFAGALAALVTWWVQGFAAKRGFVVRFLFALFVFVVAFCSFGGLLRVIYQPRHLSEPAGLVAPRPLLGLAQRLRFLRALHAGAATPGLCRADAGGCALCRDLRTARGRRSRYVRG